MSLSIKAAMLVSMAFIVGTSYVVGIAAPSEQFLPSPLRGAAVSVRPNPVALETAVGEMDWLNDVPAWSHQLERKSPVEIQPSGRREAIALDFADLPTAPQEDVLRLPPVAASRELPSEVDPETGPEFTVTDVPAGDRIIGDEVLAPTASRRAPLESFIIPATVDPAHLPTPAIAEIAKYEVRPGDTLASIARKVSTARDQRTIQQLMDANPGLEKRAGKLRAGDVLIIPSSSSGSHELATKVAASPARTAKSTKSAASVNRTAEPVPAKNAATKVAATKSDRGRETSAGKRSAPVKNGKRV